MHDRVVIKGIAQEYYLLLGASYQIEQNTEIETAEKFEKKSGEMVRLYKELYGLINNTQQNEKIFFSKISFFEKKLQIFSSNLLKGAVLFNNLAVFNLLFTQILDQFDSIVAEKYRPIKYLDMAKHYILKAMPIVEQKLVSVEYKEISEAVVFNYVKIIEEYSD